MLTTQEQMMEFLEEYKRSRIIIEGTVKATLVRALAFEEKFNKPFYRFSLDEILEMYKSISSMSERALVNANTALKHASQWFLDQNDENLASEYDKVTKTLLKDCIDKEELDEIISILPNSSDRAIIKMLFLGVGGHMLKELTFLNIPQTEPYSGTITLNTGKVIPISEEDFDLLKAGCAEEELLVIQKNNKDKMLGKSNFSHKTRIISVKSLGLTKIRFNTILDSTDIDSTEDLSRRYRYIYRRLRIISEWVGKNLTASGLKGSGLVYCMREAAKESGTSIRKYITSPEGTNLLRRYEYTSQDVYWDVLNKFKKYLNEEV